MPAPTLRELQDMVFHSLVERDDAPAAAQIVDGGLPPDARLNVYRNTFIGTLTKALQLSYPAVYRLVGAAFFESAARVFIEAAPPQSACLDLYGAEFTQFLAGFPPAQTLAYLPDVAHLEWAVTTALHAPDVPALELSRITALDPELHARVVLIPHPAVGLLRADHPADAIWRAVLAQDDAALKCIELNAGPVRLLVDRRDTVEVQRVDGPAWTFMHALCAGCTLQAAIESAPELDDPAMALAEHLAAGRFVGFKLDDDAPPAISQEVSA